MVSKDTVSRSPRIRGYLAPAYEAPVDLPKTRTVSTNERTAKSKIERKSQRSKAKQDAMYKKSTQARGDRVAPVAAQHHAEGRSRPEPAPPRGDVGD